ncbi:MAG: hypothetical protein H6507_10915 [Calditrichaeota bacterium]|nr:hypothetical protein [Calditrichota bacterium]
MTVTITERLHDFLFEKKLITEVAKRMGKKLTTLASELNPGASYAKFGINDFLPLCVAVREMGYGDELDAILHEYFEALKSGTSSQSEPYSSQELSAMVVELMTNTATLANKASKLFGTTDKRELREVRSLISQHLLPTALKLAASIDSELDSGSDTSVEFAN